MRLNKNAPVKSTDPRHGTESCYKYWSCRCDRCRSANAERVKERQDASNPPSHGRVGYEYGCRCNTCRTGKKETMQALATARKQWKELHGTAPTDRANLSRLA